MNDLDHDAAMAEHGMASAVGYYVTLAKEVPMARRFTLADVDEAIRVLESARYLIASAKQKTAA